MRNGICFLVVVSLFFGLCGANVFAANTQEVLLVRGTTNAIKKHPNASFNLVFVINQETGDVLGLKANGSLVNPRFYSFSKFAEGVPLVQLRGKAGEKPRDVVLIKSENFKPGSGGTFEIGYLTNGLFGSWNQITVQVVRDSDGWKMLMDGQNGWEPVRNLFIEKNTMFGNVIGISSIHNID